MSWYESSGNIQILLNMHKDSRRELFFPPNMDTVAITCQRLLALFLFIS